MCMIDEVSITKNPETKGFVARTDAEGDTRPANEKYELNTD